MWLVPHHPCWPSPCPWPLPPGRPRRPSFPCSLAFLPLPSAADLAPFLFLLTSQHAARRDGERLISDRHLPLGAAASGGQDSLCQDSLCQHSLCQDSLCQHSLCQDSLCQHSLCQHSPGSSPSWSASATRPPAAAMGRPGALLLLLLLLVLGAPGALADICIIPEVDSSLVLRLGQRLLPWMDQLSLEELNPSIYVGLRLSSMETSHKEAFYLHSLKVNYQQSFLRHAPSGDSGDLQAKPSMGQLALYMLALKANCEFIGGHKGDRLVSQLKRFLEDEKRSIGQDHKGRPPAGYYQYGLSILALCVHQKRLHDSVVSKLLLAVEHDRHLHQGALSVDTLAMAGLAFICLERSNLNSNLRPRITLALRKAQEKVLRAQTPEGYFGNVYSTPLALQLLTASPMPGTELGTACLHARAALLASLRDGAFQNTLVISQLLPVLNHRSYVDLVSPDCLAPRVLLEPAAATPPPLQLPGFIRVMLKVPSVWPPYAHAVPVPAGASLEAVLWKARQLGEFMYGTRASLSGPYLTSVMGKEAGAREFWQLVRAPDTPLQQGIADYIPKDGETIELRLVRW